MYCIPRVRSVSISVELITLLQVRSLQNGKTLHTKHFGYRDIQQNACPDDQTRYNINSMTKAMVAALAGIIASTGHIDLHASVKSYLPDFACHESSFDDQVTIIDLLSHRTGFTNFDPIWLGSQNSLLLSRDQTLKTFATLKPCEPFRASFLYNNWGYELIGKILETVTGDPLHVLLHEKIFRPLGMTRTSTNWDLDEENTTKSYVVLQDLTPVPIGRSELGQGTLMEAAGGVKSTIEDLTIFYTSFIFAVNDQVASDSDSTHESIFHHCRDLVTNHARLPGMSLREQGYGAGWTRSQLPGQLGRTSFNPSIGPEPITGKGSESRLILYHHGSMPGSTSCVHLVPELDAFIVVLQNSIAPIDTADFVRQYLLEGFLHTKRPNDYKQLATEFTTQSLGHMDRIKKDLDTNRMAGTSPRPLDDYTGIYWNHIANFSIEISQVDSALQMCFQGRASEVFQLTHYHDDVFSWWMPYDEVARRGRTITDYPASYYLISFSSKDGEGIHVLKWAWDPNMETDVEEFGLGRVSLRRLK
ncbi:beta-lactamase/transpeptidase-like protein [Penicillium brevicompactum]|uniref:Beta-lactamase/transpeptidase-like protein n=1 Tax=Penicillium brevicompactum TaxID=5074 RepID=A0A9W9QXP9_PENBR|nr:beta-lactamase/transpeptidase-like protein [Penicillium brevicompactum]